MYNKKPEFIDPDEKNLTYFYHRTKEKKPLEKNEDCTVNCDKRFFFGFKAKNARFPLLLFMYAGLIFAVFYFAHKKFSQNTDLSIQNVSGVQYILSIFKAKDQNEHYAQILTLNQEKKSTLLEIEQIVLKTVGEKNQLMQEYRYPAQKIELEASGLKNITYRFQSAVQVYKVKIILFMKNHEKIELEKEF